MNAKERRKLAEISDKKYLCFFDGSRKNYLLVNPNENLSWRYTRQEATRLSRYDYEKWQARLIGWGYAAHRMSFES